MVNFVDTFTKMYGRKPTENEAAFLMRVKAERDARLNKNMKPKEGLLVASKRSQHHAQEAAAQRKTNRNRLVNVTARVFTINKLIGYKLDNEQIADALGLEVWKVEREIKNFKLPRDDIRKREY